GGAERASLVPCRRCHGLMFADGPAAAVGEAVHVLRPHGRFAAMTWARRADNPWLGIVLDAVGAQFGMPFPPPSLEAWWERVPQLAGPLGAMLEAMDAETRAAIRGRALADAARAAQATDGGVSLG